MLTFHRIPCYVSIINTHNATGLMYTLVVNSVLTVHETASVEYVDKTRCSVCLYVLSQCTLAMVCTMPVNADETSYKTQLKFITTGMYSIYRNELANNTRNC